MENYFKLREQLRNIQKELQGKLEEVLEINHYDKSSSWFNFNNDTFIIIWTNSNLPMEILNDLETVFGEIDCIYTSTISQNIQIKFKKVEE